MWRGCLNVSHTATHWYYESCSQSKISHVLAPQNTSEFSFKRQLSSAHRTWFPRLLLFVPKAPSILYVTHTHIHYITLHYITLYYIILSITYYRYCICTRINFLCLVGPILLQMLLIKVLVDGIQVAKKLIPLSTGNLP